MSQTNRSLWQQFWHIGKPYWFSQEKWRARGLLLLLVVLSIGSSIFLVLETIQRGELISALAARDLERFLRTVLIFLGIIIVSVPLVSFNTYVQSKLSLDWRRWLTNRFINLYLSDRTFYQINLYPEIDNPDQRIAEDIKTFTQQSLFFLVICLESVLQLIGFTGVLWSISKPLLVFLIIYTLAGNAITVFIFGRVLVGINFEQVRKEAEFRFSLIRVRENAESIAFYRGQNQESRQVEQRFFEAFRNFNRLIRWQLNLELFRNSYQYVSFLIPGLILAPRILTGNLEVGAVIQSQAAFERIWLALSRIVYQFQELTVLGAAVDRLEKLARYLEKPTRSERPLRPLFPGCPIRESVARRETTGLPLTSLTSKESTTINAIENSHIAFQNLTIVTPDRRTTIVENLSLTILPGQGLLIVGVSGVGKSSLLRTVAGLWQFGTGTLVKPKKEEMLFLPQRPYSILGSLRRQLLYPQSDREISELQLLQILQRVNLLDLVTKFGSLEAIEDWSQVLSMGEQQRLAFARLLLMQPKYAVLDEATSALDVKNEELLYEQLRKTPTTFISVGHRSTLLKYHQQVLELAGDRTWRLVAAESYVLG